MDEKLLATVLDAGIGALSVCVIAFLFYKMMKAHREERNEFREDIKEGRDNTNKVLQDLTDVIRDINK